MLRGVYNKDMAAISPLHNRNITQLASLSLAPILLKSWFFNVVFSLALKIIELLCTLFGGGNPQGLLLVIVKVGGVAGPLALGNKGSLDLKMLYSLV